MKKGSLLIIAITTLFVVGCSEDKINTTKTESGFNVPIVKVNNEDDKIEISRVLFEEYLKLSYENYLNDNNKKINILKDYKINEIKVLEDLNSEVFRIEITYDLQSIDGYATVFETGNGVLTDDNWVKGKYQVVDIKKLGNNKYTILDMYTA